MSEDSSGFKPFYPGRRPDEDGEPASGEGGLVEPVSLDDVRESEESGSGEVSAFAVPEPSAGRALYESRVVLREADDEDEDALIEAAGSSVLEPRRFEAERFERVFVILLFLLSTLAVVASTPGVGMCWDEAYYVDASRRTLDWFSAVGASDGAGLVNAKVLNHYWDTATQEPRGHAAVARWLTTLGLALMPAGRAPLFWMRLPVAVCFGLTLVFLYLLARHCYGHITAWLTVVAYLFMPRIFGHAHFAVTETVTVFVTVLTVYAFLRGLESPIWAALTGVFFGVALATKINGFFLPAMLLPWAFLFRRRAALGNLYAMIFLGPVAMVAVWPWMWTDTARHFLQYVAWNIDHDQIGMLFRDKLYGPGNPAPWTYPIVLAALTLPLGTLFLLALGLARTVQSPRRHFAMGALVLWAAAVPILAMMRPGGPKYDGVRLFLPAFPFIAMMAGLGGSVLVRIVAIFDRRGQRLPRSQAALLVILALLALNGGVAIVRSGPYYLSYYNALAGGRAAASKQMDITYWGAALNRAAVERINAAVPDGATLAPLAMHDRVLELYQEWGWLKPQIRLVAREDRSAQYYLLHYRRGFFGGIEKTLYGAPSLRVLTIGPEDAPMFGLYRGFSRASANR